MDKDIDYISKPELCRRYAKLQEQMAGMLAIIGHHLRGGDLTKPIPLEALDLNIGMRVRMEGTHEIEDSEVKRYVVLSLIPETTEEQQAAIQD